MTTIDSDFQNYYRERLQSKRQALTALYQRVLSRQKAQQSLNQILMGLLKASAFPELVQLANKTLSVNPEEQSLCLKQLLLFLTQTPILSQKPGTEIIQKSLAEILHIYALYPDLEKELVELRSLAHSLAGSGGTYGFPDISEHASMVEYAPLEEICPALERLLLVIQQHILVEPQTALARVLLVQKDPDLKLLIQHLLESEGITCDAVSTASEVWFAIVKQTYALIITDLVLPDLDGRRLIHELRLRPETYQAKILLLAASSHSKEVENTEIDAFMLKPIVPAKLKSQVRKLLNHSRFNSQALEMDSSTGFPNLAAFKALIRSLKYEHASFALFSLSSLSPALLQLWLKVLRADILPQDFPVGLEHQRVLLLRTDVSPQQMLLFVQSFFKSLSKVWPDAFESSGIKASIDFFSKEDLDIQIAKLQAQLTDSDLEVSANIFMPDLNAQVPIESKRILLADDDPLIASILRFRIEQEGFLFSALSEGDHVLPDLERSLPDLLILDLKMPGQDGFSVLKELRTKYSQQELPVLILTSLGDEYHVVHGLELGANDFMTKPFSPEELLSRIQRLIKSVN
jgi:DNA-binding response OmpR family regulator